MSLPDLELGFKKKYPHLCNPIKLGRALRNLKPTNSYLLQEKNVEAIKKNK